MKLQPRSLEVTGKDGVTLDDFVSWREADFSHKRTSNKTLDPLGDSVPTLR